MTRSSAIRCRRMASRRRSSRKSFFPACRSPAIIRCIRSPSTAKAHLFVDLGSATNSCQLQNRIANSPGHQPCTELETRAGIWLYDANKKDQHFSPAERYATGLRNGEGFAFDSAGRLFVTQHGRDQLSQNWPSFFTAEQSAELPAEEIVQLEKGADYGWPECYYDQTPEQARAGAGIWRRRQEGRGLRREKRLPVASLPGALGAERSPDLCGQRLSRRVSRRRLCRLPRLVESRARAAGRLQRRLSAARRRQSRRAVCRLRRRLCRRGERAGPGGVPAVGTRHGTRWRPLYLRRCARPHLARHLSRRSRCDARAGAGAEDRRH